MSGVALALGITSAVIAVASAATSVGMSVDAKNKQKAAQRRAEKEADKSIKAAKRSAAVRYMEKLAIAEQPYRVAQENLASVAATGIEASRQNPRQAAAAVGQAMMSNLEAGQKIRADQSTKLYDLAKLKAEEEQAIQKTMVDIELGNVEGAQMAAAQAEEQAALADQQIAQGVGDLASAAVSGVSAGVDFANYKQNAGAIDTMTNTGLSVGDMGNKFVTSLGASTPEGGKLQAWLSANPNATMTQLHSAVISESGKNNSWIANQF